MTITSRAGTEATQRRSGRRMLGLATILIAAGSIAMSQAIAPEAASAAPVSQCNSVDNTPGLGIECDVTVENHLDLTSGSTSSTITTRECHGAANTVPSVCSGPTVTSSTQLVLAVSQCNSVLDGGGASLFCNIRVRNTITGNATATAPTINQCDDSLAGGLVVLRACSPDGSTTTNATITQCNHSDNGGTSSLTCTVQPGSLISASLPVHVAQCNSSANGGGSLIVCTVGITTTVIPSVEVVENTAAGSGTTAGAGVGPGTGITPGTGPGTGRVMSPRTSTRVHSGASGILAHTGTEPAAPLGMGVLAVTSGIVLVLAAKRTSRI